MAVPSFPPADALCLGPGGWRISVAQPSWDGAASQTPGEEGRETHTQVYAEFIFSRISTCPGTREVAGLTPWALRTPSSPPAGPS